LNSPSIYNIVHGLTIPCAHSVRTVLPFEICDTCVAYAEAPACVAQASEKALQLNESNNNKI
jgi:hypothetical protein